MIPVLPDCRFSWFPYPLGLHKKSTRSNSGAKVANFYETAFTKADKNLTELDKLTFLGLSAAHSVVRRRHSNVLSEGSGERTMILKSAAVTYLYNRNIQILE